MTPHPPSLARWSPLSRSAGEGAECNEAAEGTAVASIRQWSFVAYLQALPLAVVFLLFFVAPIALVVVVSFFGYETYQILIPGFTLDNYREVFSEGVTYSTYLITVKFCVIVWAITSVLGFFIAYFLAFQLRSRTSQTVLLLLCSIPFWTSIVIRMIPGSRCSVAMVSLTARCWGSASSKDHRNGCSTPSSPSFSATSISTR